MRELTYGQHAMWFTEQVGAAGGAFGMALGVRFGPGLNETALRAACARVVAQHPALRSAVHLVDGVPHLVELAPGPELVTAELSDEAVRAAIRDPFDLAEGPLARLVLLRGADEHRLVIAVHHLCFDGMSKDVLARDLAAAYNAAIAGTDVAAPVPAPGPASSPVSASSAVSASRPVSASSPGVDLAAARAYWERHWSPPSAPVLPDLDSPTALTVASPGESVEFSIGAGLAGALEQAATQVKVSRFEFLLAVIHAVLARYGNAGHLVGVSVSTRTPAEAGVIGSFVNELPLAIAEPAATFAAYARDLRVRLREVYPYRSVHLGQVVTGLRPAVTLTPLSVGYRRRAAEPPFTGVASQVDWMLFNGAARNALHIQVVDSGTDAVVSLQYDPTRLPGEAVGRIGAHLRTALAWCAAGPDRPLWQLEVIPAEERALVEEWNATVRPYQPAATVVSLFAAQVRRTPDATAASDGRRVLTYRHLDRLSRAFAARLRAAGVGRGTRVAVALPRSIEALVALLGIMRAKAAYVPVDPTYPAGRQALIIEDAAPALVVSTLTLDDLADPAGSLNGAGSNGVGPDGVGPDGVGPDGTGPSGAGPDGTGLDDEAGPEPRDTAYIMYTSGSTGRPKGVIIPHRGLANELLSLRDVLGSGSDDRWLALASLSFDISTVELFLPLISGGTTVIAAGYSALDGRGLVAFIADQRITHVQATPSGWRVLLEAGFGEPAPRRGEPEPALDDLGHRAAAAVAPRPGVPVVALVGGEALPVPLAAQLRSRVQRLINVYGPTETTVWATAGDVPLDPARITVGAPLANLRVHVLDATLRPLPIGVPGEICIAGTGMADGYLGRPGWTADRFVPDPYGLPGRRLYRTGDIGYWDSRGRLVCGGRRDNQVKIRGNRIELGEIEANLVTAPGVEQAVVTVHGEGQDARLVAYVVGTGGAPDPAALRDYLAQRLTTVMVPTAWVFLDALPLNANGKVDRRALPAPPPPEPVAVRANGSLDDIDNVADNDSADDVVSQLRAIWQEVLQVDDIGIDDDLFDLGGHSLTITRINGRVHQLLGVELPLDVYFDTPTIAEIAEVVRQTAQLQGLAIGGDR